jgi:hypothetical protein
MLKPNKNIKAFFAGYESDLGGTWNAEASLNLLGSALARIAW